MPKDPDQALAAMRGQNLAWALANVPGTAFIVVTGTMHAFVRDAGHSPKPVDRVARYVDLGVAAFFSPARAAV